MSPIDPRELGPGPTPTGVYDEGFRCVKCQYDLAGLPRGSVCPECGTPNARPTYDKKRGTGVSRAPIAYVDRLATWLWAAAFALFASWFFGLIAGVAPHPITWGLHFLVAAGWLAALVMATRPKPDRYEPVEPDAFDNTRLRLVTLITQSFWLLAIGLATISWFMPAQAGLETIVAYTVTILGMLAAFGFVPLGIQLASLANWMGDHEAETRCRTASWLIAAYGVGILLAQVTPLVALFLAIFWICYFVGVVLLAVNLVTLARAATWAAQNSRHKTVVSGRRQAIEHQREQEAGAVLEERLAALDHQGGPRAGRTGIPKDIPVPKSHTIERPEDAAPYEVKDE